jgi:hypothetical protein
VSHHEKKLPCGRPSSGVHAVIFGSPEERTMIHSDPGLQIQQTGWHDHLLRLIRIRSSRKLNQRAGRSWWKASLLKKIFIQIRGENFHADIEEVQAAYAIMNEVQDKTK